MPLVKMFLSFLSCGQLRLQPIKDVIMNNIDDIVLGLCLHLLVRLNVFTRDLVVAKRRPVVVWIHGGSFSRFKVVLALTSLW